MSSNELLQPLEIAESLKQHGNELYKEQKYLEAIEFYNRSLERVKDIGTISNLLLNVGTVALKIDSSMASARIAVVYATACPRLC